MPTVTLRKLALADVFAKLQISSRAQLAAEATRRQAR